MRQVYISLLHVLILLFLVFKLGKTRKLRVARLLQEVPHIDSIYVYKWRDGGQEARLDVISINQAIGTDYFTSSLDRDRIGDLNRMRCLSDMDLGGPVNLQLVVVVDKLCVHLNLTCSQNKIVFDLIPLTNDDLPLIIVFILKNRQQFLEALSATHISQERIQVASVEKVHFYFEILIESYSADGAVFSEIHLKNFQGRDCYRSIFSYLDGIIF